VAIPAFDESGNPSDPTALDEVSRRALEIYEQSLKPRLEPEHNGEAIAIDISSEKHAVRRTTGEALRALRQISPDGELVVMRVGPEPEYGLAARLLAAQARAKRDK